MQLDEKEAEVNQKVTRGLKERLDMAECELERLKRKRKDSVSPDRVVTEILKRPGASPPPLSSKGNKVGYSHSLRPTNTQKVEDKEE